MSWGILGCPGVIRPTHNKGSKVSYKRTFITPSNSSCYVLSFAEMSSCNTKNHSVSSAKWRDRKKDGNSGLQRMLW